MSSRQFRIVIVLVVASGLVGGALCNLLLPRHQVLAQEQAAKEVVRAEEFCLVGQEGKPLAQLKLDSSGCPVLVFLDDSGQGQVLLGLPESHPKLELYNTVLRDAPKAFKDGATIIAGGYLYLYDSEGRVMNLVPLEETGGCIRTISPSEFEE